MEAPKIDNKNNTLLGHKRAISYIFCFTVRLSLYTLLENEHCNH